MALDRVIRWTDPSAMPSHEHLEDFNGADCGAVRWDEDLPWTCSEPLRRLVAGFWSGELEAM